MDILFMTLYFIKEQKISQMRKYVSSGFTAYPAVSETSETISKCEAKYYH